MHTMYRRYLAYELSTLCCRLLMFKCLRFAGAQGVNDALSHRHYSWDSLKASLQISVNLDITSYVGPIRWSKPIADSPLGADVLRLPRFLFQFLT